MDRHLLPDEIDQLLDGEAGFGTAPLRMHVRQCAECRAALEEARTLVGSLERLPRLAPSAAFAGGVLARVEIFTPWHVALGDAVRAWVPRSHPARMAAGALAAVVLLASGALSAWLLIHTGAVAAAVEMGMVRWRAEALGAMGGALTGVLGASGASAVRAAGSLGIAAAVVALLAAMACVLALLRAVATGRWARRVHHTLPRLGILVLLLGASARASMAQAAAADPVPQRVRSTPAATTPAATTPAAMSQPAAAQPAAASAHPSATGLLQRPPREQRSVARALGLAVSWLVLLVVIGVVVLRMAPAPLDGVVHTVAAHFTRSAVAGLVAQLALLPALLLGAILLALTVVGIPLVPVAAIAAVVVVAGVATLGFLAMAYLGGAAVLGAAGRGVRARTVLLAAGLAPYFALWLLAALTTRVAVLGGILYLIAVLATWAAVTVGAGAVILSRRPAPWMRPLAPLREPAPVDDFLWQTPTPVSGVAAARRPTPVVPPRES